jgi:hypothetical protein
VRVESFTLNVGQPLTTVPFAGDALVLLPLLLLSSVVNAGAQSPAQDARLGLLHAWDNHTIVAVAEAHRTVQDKESFLTLITAPEFSQRVNDIVVEFGNARLQPILDRYIAGARVPLDQVRRVWAAISFGSALQLCARPSDSVLARGVWMAEA